MIPKFTVKDKNVALSGKLLLKLDYMEMQISSGTMVGWNWMIFLANTIQHSETSKSTNFSKSLIHSKCTFLL